MYSQFKKFNMYTVKNIFLGNQTRNILNDPSCIERYVLVSKQIIVSVFSSERYRQSSSISLLLIDWNSSFRRTFSTTINTEYTLNPQSIQSFLSLLPPLQGDRVSYRIRFRTFIPLQYGINPLCLPLNFKVPQTEHFSFLLLITSIPLDVYVLPGFVLSNHTRFSTFVRSHLSHTTVRSRSNVSKYPVPLPKLKKGFSFTPCQLSTNNFSSYDTS